MIQLKTPAAAPGPGWNANNAQAALSPGLSPPACPGSPRCSYKVVARRYGVPARKPLALLRTNTRAVPRGARSTTDAHAAQRMPVPRQAARPEPELTTRSLRTCKTKISLWLLVTPVPFSPFAANRGARVRPLLPALPLHLAYETQKRIE